MGAGFTKSLVEAGVLRLIDSERALKLIGAKAKVTKGFYSKGVSYIIADNLPVSLDPYGLVLHEIGVHALNLGKNSKEFKTILDDISKQIGVNKEVTEAYNRVPKDTKPEKVMEEVCAYLIEHHPALPLSRRVLAWFRAQLKRLTNNVNFMAGINRLTPDDLAYMAHTALRSAANPAIDTVPSSTPVYSRSDATKVAYEKRIDALFNGAAPRNVSGVKVLDKSDMLDMLGLGNHEVVIAENHAVKEGMDNHGLTPEDWKKIPDWIDNPIAVFQRDDGHVAFIAPELKNGNPIIIAMNTIGGQGERSKKLHLVLTAYEKTSRLPVDRMIKDGWLRYINTRKSPEFNRGSRLQLPSSATDFRGSTSRVLTEKDLVKYLRSQNEPLYSFAGERAQNADVAKLDTAKSMLNSGTNPEIVRQLTGWHKGADGKFKFEISDSESSLKNLGTDDSGYSNRSTSLNKILNHAELFKAYPFLNDIDVSINIDPERKNYGGSFTEGTPGDEEFFGSNPEISVFAESKERALSVLLHEVQHAIQSHEDFARGGSPDEFNSDKLSSISSHKLYQQLSGEVESRNTQARQGLTAEQRKATSPQSTQDIPDAEHIVKFGNGVAMSATGEKPEDFVIAPDGSINFGEITPEIAKVIKRQAGKIRLNIGKEAAKDKFGIVHIEHGHKKEIDNTGLSTYEFVHNITSNPDEIRTASGGALLLAKEIKDRNQIVSVAIVRLTPSISGDFYRVETAFVSKVSSVYKKYPLLWKKSETTSPNSSNQASFAALPSKLTGEDRSNGTLDQNNLNKSIAQTHTDASFKSALTETMDKEFGNGWTNRLFGTGKFKSISNAEALRIVGGESKFHKVWHGSPHIHSKFDSEKIGSGEGAQAFGYGHYFASNKQVAEFYRNELSRYELLLDGKRLLSANWNSGMKPWIQEGFEDLIPEKFTEESSLVTGRKAKILKYVLAEDFDLMRSPPSVFTGDGVWSSDNLRQEFYDWVKSQKPDLTKGALYEVDLAPDQDKYLLWDMPISEQSDTVKNALSKLLANNFKSSESDTGERIYKLLTNEYQGDKEASTALLANGIRGIKYLDRGSRSESEKTFNYVVFDDNDITIEARYSKDGKIIAFFNPANDTTYFVHDNISKDDSPAHLLGLMRHELGVHALQMGRDTPEFQGILKQVEALKETNKAVKEAFNRVPEDTKAHLITEEALGYLVENHPGLDVVQKFKAWLKSKIRDLGKALGIKDRAIWVRWANTLNDRDLVFMATSALKSAPDSLAFDGDRSGDAMASESKLLAPNGKPSNLNARQYAQVRTPEFKAFFGDWENDPETASKVVDGNGEPLVVYHGTTGDFNEFDNLMLGKNTQSYAGMLGFFLGDKEAANLFTKKNFDKPKSKIKENANIIPVFINIRKPQILPLQVFELLQIPGGWFRMAKLKYQLDGTLPSYAPTAKKNINNYLTDEQKNDYKLLFDKQIKEAGGNVLSQYGDSKGMHVITKVNNADGVMLLAWGKSYPDKPMPQSFADFNNDQWVVFNSNQIKSAIGNNGQFDTNNNDIRFSQHSTAPANHATTLINNAIAEVKDMAAAIPGKQPIGYIGGFMTRNMLMDLAEDLNLGTESHAIKAALNKFKSLVGKKDNFTNFRLKSVDADYHKMKDSMNADEARLLARVQSMATRAGFDPSDSATVTELNHRMNNPENSTNPEFAAIIATESNLVDEYNSMTQAAKDAYAMQKEAFKQDFIAQENALVQRIMDFNLDSKSTTKIIAEIRAQFDNVISKGVYFPLSRFGDRVITADKLDDQGNKIPGENIVEFAESDKDAFKRIKLMQDAGYSNVKITMKDKYIAGNADELAANNIAAMSIEAINKIQDDNTPMNETEKNELFDKINQQIIEALPANSYRKHFIHRKGTEGNSLDGLRAYANTRNAAAKSIASLKFDHKIAAELRTADKLVKSIRSADGSVTDTRAIASIMDELKLREEALAKSSISPITQALTTAGFIGAMGFNVSSAAVNMSQIGTTGLAELSGRYGVKNSLSALKFAFGLAFDKNLLSTKSGLDFLNSPVLNNPENAAIKRALQAMVDNGKIDLTMSHDAIAAASLDSYNTSPLADAWRKFAKASGILFHFTEAFNRQIMTIAAFKLAHEQYTAKGDVDGFNKAVADASDVLDRTQFDYSQANRARYMMPEFTRVLFLFKSYALQMTYYIGRNINNALAGQTPEIRMAARKNIAVQAAVAFSLSGSFGLPIGVEMFEAVGATMGFKRFGAVGGAVPGALMGYAVFNAFLAALGADDDDELEDEFRVWATEHFGHDFASMTTKGLARAIPGMPDVAGRTSLRDIWWPNDTKELEGRAQYSQVLQTLAGPVGGQFANIATFGKLMADGEMGRAIEAILPAAARNVMAAGRMATEGVNSIDGNKMTRDLTASEVALKSLGFGPVVVADTYRANSAIQNRKDKARIERTLVFSEHYQSFYALRRQSSIFSQLNYT